MANTIKSYVGKGAKHYSVKQREEKLNAKLNEIASKDENFEFTFTPATNKEQFDRLYTQYMSENADYEDIKETKEKKSFNKDNIDDSNKKDSNFYLDDTLPSEQTYGLDEMATKNVNTRDYVLEDGMSKSDGKKYLDFDGNKIEKDFSNEPKDWDEAFKIPEPDEKEIFIDNDDNGFTSTTSGGRSSSSGFKGGSTNSSSKNTSNQRPMNPHSEDLSKGKQRRNAKRMATIAVDLLSKVSEITFVYFCNKNITHEKLIELQDEGLIDLDFLIELEQGQAQPIRIFFMNQRLQAEELAKLSQDDKDDIIEALTEVIMEKGIALTPLQQLGLTVASIGVKQIISGYALSSMNKGILEYAMNHQAGIKSEQPEIAEIPKTEPQTSESQIEKAPNNNITPNDELERELEESTQSLVNSENEPDDVFVAGVSSLS